MISNEDLSHVLNLSSRFFIKERNPRKECSFPMRS